MAPAAAAPLDLDAALGGLLAAARDYARHRTPPALRSFLQRALDEAATALPPALRQRLERTVLGSEPAQTALADLLALHSECLGALEEDVSRRATTLRATLSRWGALLDPGLAEKALRALRPVPRSEPDPPALLDRRRGMSLLEAEAERRRSGLRQEWESARLRVAEVVGEEAVRLAAAALEADDPLPAAEALWAATRGDRAEAGAVPAPEGRALEVRLRADGALLSPAERAWARALSARAARRAGAGEAGAAWDEAVRCAERSLGEIAAARRAALEALEPRLGEEAASLPGAGFRRLTAGLQALRRRHAAAQGRLAQARRRALETEWDLSRAAWEEGGWVSVAGALEARRAFLDLHRARELTAESTLEEAAGAAGRAAARLRLEASWRRRALLRAGGAGEEARDRETRRLEARLGVDPSGLGDGDLEALLRATEAGLRAALALLCADIAGSEGEEPPVARRDRERRARAALEAADPAALESALREARS